MLTVPSRRLVGALTALCLVVAMLAAAATPASGDDIVVLDQGHVDLLEPHLDGGELSLLVKDDRVPPPVRRDPTDVLVYAKAGSHMVVPPGFEFLGDPGDSVWILPQTQDPELVWLGWNTEVLSTGVLDDDQVEFDLVGFDGPGDLFLFTTGSFGGVGTMFIDTVDPAPDAWIVQVGRHVHANWAFTEKGDYTLTFEIRGSINGNEVTTGPVPYAFRIVDSTPVVLSDGHVDLIEPRYIDGELILQVHDDRTSPSVRRHPSEVLVHGTPDSEFEVPDHPAFEFLGEPGDPVWILPQVEIPGRDIVWLGWNTQQLPTGVLDGDEVEYELLSVEGDGDLFVYVEGPTGLPVEPFYVDPTNEEPDAWIERVNSHVHVNWAFTEPGAYTLTFEVRGTIDGAPVSTGPHEFAFQIDPDETAGVSPPEVMGTPAVGETLLAHRGQWDTPVPVFYSYQWQAVSGGSAVDIGVDSPRHVVEPEHVGADIQVVVTVTDLLGRVVSATSVAVGPVTAAAPSNLAPPRIAGTSQVGAAVRVVDDGVWGSDLDLVYTYRWRAHGVNIAGATAATYTLTADEVGATITVQVTATDPIGQTASATSNRLGPVVAASGPGPGDPGDPDPDDPAPGGPDPVVPVTFDDVSSDHVFAADIGWLGGVGITRGCNPPANTRFCPDDPVTRGQMAAFLVRALDLPQEGGGFEDTAGNVFEGDVAALAAAGITRGCNPPANTRFCPDDPVTRGQMAAFLVRGLALASGSDGFEDTVGHVFENDVSALAGAGITRGCNPPANTRFCPDDPVTRGQMAAFLRRALDEEAQRTG